MGVKGKDIMQTRRDVYDHMCSGGSYEDLLTYDASKNGFIFETITQLLHLHKMLPRQFDYTTLYRGYEKEHTPVKHVDEILNLPIHQGDDASDITFKQDKMSCVSVKYRESFDINEHGITQLKDYYPAINILYVCKDKMKIH